MALSIVTADTAATIYNKERKGLQCFFSYHSFNTGTTLDFQLLSGLCKSSRLGGAGVISLLILALVSLTVVFVLKTSEKGTSTQTGKTTEITRTETTTLTERATTMETTIKSLVLGSDTELALMGINITKLGLTLGEMRELNNNAVGKEKVFRAGTEMKLTCTIKDITQTPSYIFW